MKRHNAQGVLNDVILAASLCASFYGAAMFIRGIPALEAQGVQATDVRGVFSDTVTCLARRGECTSQELDSVEIFMDNKQPMTDFARMWLGSLMALTTVVTDPRKPFARRRDTPSAP